MVLNTKCNIIMKLMEDEKALNLLPPNSVLCQTAIVLYEILNWSYLLATLEIFLS